jgi:diamine N-acetyltransferase
MKVGYRQGQAIDALALSVLARSSFAETFGHLYASHDLESFFETKLSAKAMERQLSDPDHSFLMAHEQNGDLIGFAQVCPMSLPFDAGNRRARQLDRLYVLASAQGRGIGHTLLDWALNACWEQGAEDIYLSVYCDNHRAQAIYAKRGFEIVGRYDFFVGNHADDERIMRLSRETAGP